MLVKLIGISTPTPPLEIEYPPFGNLEVMYHLLGHPDIVLCCISNK